MLNFEMLPHGRNENDVSGIGCITSSFVQLLPRWLIQQKLQNAQESDLGGSDPGGVPVWQVRIEKILRPSDESSNKGHTNLSDNFLGSKGKSNKDLNVHWNSPHEARQNINPVRKSLGWTQFPVKPLRNKAIQKVGPNLKALAVRVQKTGAKFKVRVEGSLVRVESGKQYIRRRNDLPSYQLHKNFSTNLPLVEISQFGCKKDTCVHKCSAVRTAGFKEHLAPHWVAFRET